MIGPLEESELPRILEIERASYPTPWSERMFRQEFSNPLGIRFAFRTDRIEGYIFGWMIFEDLHINNVTVAPEARRKGAGAALLDALLAEARSRGAHRVILEVRPSNEAAIALYRKFGFSDVMIRKGYYSDTGEDGMVLGKTL